MKIQHPAFPEIVKDVTAYASWRDAGWIVLDDKEPEPEPAAEQAPEVERDTPSPKPRRSRKRSQSVSDN